MLVLVALAFAVVAGTMGLAVDYGFVALERRTLQKAADSAAMSGALDLADSTSWSSIDTDVNSMISKNGVPFGTSTSCTLVDASNQQVQNNCNSPTNDSTSGVKVTLTHTRDTFFMGLLGARTATVSATSTGRLYQQNDYNAGAAMFIVCGFNTRLAGGGNNTYDILETSGGSYSVRDSAVSKRFVIHGPQVADCNANNSNFKGLYGETGFFDLPHILHYTEGTVAGPTTVATDGPNGCPAGTTTFNGCVMVLPVVSSVWGTTSDKAMNGVFWLPFLIYDNGANVHEGVLMSTHYTIRLHSQNISAWTIGTSGPALIGVRLVS
jgi:hypothetical protein